MKARKQLTGPDPVAYDGGQRRFAAGAHQPNGLAVFDVQSSGIIRMDLQHIRVDDSNDIGPACLCATIIMLKNRPVMRINGYALLGDSPGGK